MRTTSQIVNDLQWLVRRRNRELAFDATTKALLGAIFSLVTFGCVFWFSWVIGLGVARYLGMGPWLFGLLITGLFFGVAAWSAWRRVNPLADLKPLTHQQLLATLMSRAATGIGFSPRHAVAGIAFVLLGGPGNLIEAIGIWAHRIRADERLLGKAASTLALCKEGCPAEQISDLAAALLLRHLSLIKVVPSGNSATLTLTERGRRMAG
jgi:hypothetical protein